MWGSVAVVVVLRILNVCWWVHALVGLLLEPVREELDYCAM